MITSIFPWILPVGTINFRVLPCGHNSRVGTIQGRVQLLSQYFHPRMHTVLLADLAWTNMKSALDCDKSTWFSCTVQLGDRRWWFQLVMLHVQVLLVWSSNWTLNHAHQDNRTCTWYENYSRVGFISFSYNCRARWPMWEQFKGGKNSR